MEKYWPDKILEYWNLRTKRTKFLWRNVANHSELKQKNVEQKNINQTYFKCENNVSNARNIKKIVLSSNTFILNALSEKGIIFAWLGSVF